MPIFSAAANIVDKLFGRRRTVGVAHSVLLTFDDGPDAEVTPKVLDRLRDHQVRAVFFVVGSRINGSAQLLTRILEEGHLIGNHTYAHHLEKDPGPVAYLRDVRRNQQLLQELTGTAPRLFRAPMGRHSMGALMSPRLLGLRQVLWSVDSEDWKLRAPEDAAACGQRLAAEISAGDIVLMHDDNPCVLTVLDVLLPQLKSRGFDLHSAVEVLK